MNFTHLLLTKFNTRSFQSAGKGCDPEWLTYRFKLFDQFCYPSVLSQSNQNFKWILLFDIDTPDEFKQRIRDYSEYKNFTPVYLDFPLPYGTFPEDLRKVLQVYIDSKYLITTWLDNDDAICRDYIQIIQSNFACQNSESINFVLGYQLYQGKLYIDYEMASHFITLIEKYEPESFNTVLARDHNHLYEICSSSKNIICQPCWLEVLHGGNVMNVYRKGIRMPVEKGLRNFDIRLDQELTTKDQESFSFLMDQVRTFLFQPYSFSRKMYFIIRDPQIDFFNFLSTFKFQFASERLIQGIK